MLRYTAIGIILMAVGQDPQSAEKSGISVIKIRYGAVLFTGVMSALGGAFLSIGDIHTFTEDMIIGAGYIAIAAVIFGNWKLGRTVIACFVFGTATALQFQLPAMGVNVPNALLIMSPYLLRAARRRRSRRAAASAGRPHRSLLGPLAVTLSWEF